MKKMGKTSKILVAGASGMVGNAILNKLLNEGYNNLLGTYFSSNKFLSHASLVSYLKIDLKDQAEVANFFKTEKPEYVFFAAAKVGGIYANNTYPAQFIYDNLQIQNNVIHQSYKNNVKKLLFLGSSCIYPKLCPQPIKEEYLLTGELEPTNEAYAIAKIAGLKMCEYYNKQYACNFISVMPTNLYGPKDNYDLENSHLFPALIRKIHLAKLFEEEKWDFLKHDLLGIKIKTDNFSIIIDENSSKENIVKVLNYYGIQKNLSTNDSCLYLWGSGIPKREFLHVDDLADALIFLINNSFDSQTKNSHLNIGCNKDISIKELSMLIKKIIDYKGEIKFDNLKPDGTPQKLLDVSKLSNLGWKYKTSLSEGIIKTYKSYLKEKN